MAAGAFAGCLFRKQCPIVNTDEGRYVPEYTDGQRRLAARRREQETKVFKERYAMRSGIESTDSGVKNRLGLGKLPVRGRGIVFRVVWHKLAGWNVLRAAASRKLRAVDAAHFVFGTFLCCLWSFARIFVRAASGRQRFNILGAWNAVTRELIAVTNDGRQYRHDVRVAAQDRRLGTDWTDHAGAGQRPLSTKCRGAGIGG